MAEEYDEVADALGLPAEDEDESEQEEGQEGEGWASGSGTDAEPPPSGVEQEDAGQESSGESGDVETGEEGSDTGKPDEEPVEAKSDDQISTLMTKLEALEKSNSGLYAELRSERERRKEADARREALMAEVQKRADAEDAAKKAASLPDKDEDPVGYMTAQQKELVGSVEQRLERMEQARQQEAQREAFNQAVATVNADEDAFRQQKADYDEALNFARQERARLLRATHPDQPDEWINQQISNGDRMFALQSLQQGVSPAARAYDYATRLGYQPGQSGNGGQAAPAAAPAPAPAGQAKPAEKPKQTSLSAAAGRSGGRGRKITMEEAVELPDLEFDAIFQDPVKSRELSDNGYTFV